MLDHQKKQAEQSPYYDEAGAVLTFVVPAPKGCDLACPFCAIAQRKESTAPDILTPKHYGQFIREMAGRQKLSTIFVQGLEPLLPESYPYTEVILQTALDLGIPANVITNGTHLAEYAESLASYKINKLSVSVDSADPKIHNKLRDPRGVYDGPEKTPFHATLEGLKAAVRIPSLRYNISIISVLLPRKKGNLQGMPEYLRALGLYYWEVTALFKVGQKEVGKAAETREKLIEDLRWLKDIADSQGIFMECDDEFKNFDKNKAVKLSENEARKARTRRLEREAGHIRLQPNGQLAAGADLFMVAKNNAPKWIPGQNNAYDLIATHLK